MIDRLLSIVGLSVRGWSALACLTGAASLAGCVAGPARPLATPVVLVPTDHAGRRREGRRAGFIRARQRSVDQETAPDHLDDELHLSVIGRGKHRLKGERCDDRS